MYSMTISNIFQAINNKNFSPHTLSSLKYNLCSISINVSYKFQTEDLILISTLKL